MGDPIFLASIALTASLAIAATAIVWVASIPAERTHRWTLRIVSTLLILGVLGPFFLPRIAERVDCGEYVCARCGRCVHRLKCHGVVLWSWPGSESRGVGPNSNEYESAFSDLLGGHGVQHEWLTVGCHRRGIRWGTTIDCCTMIGDCAWFEDLPKLANRELAARYVKRFQDADWQVQGDVLRSYDDICADHEGWTPDLRFANWQEIWREVAPDWP